MTDQNKQTLIDPFAGYRFFDNRPSAGWTNRHPDTVNVKGYPMTDQPKIKAGGLVRILTTSAKKSGLWFGAVHTVKGVDHGGRIQITTQSGGTHIFTPGEVGFVAVDQKDYEIQQRESGTALAKNEILSDLVMKEATGDTYTYEPQFHVDFPTENDS